MEGTSRRIRKIKSSIARTVDALLHMMSSSVGGLVGIKFGMPSYTQRGEQVRSKAEKKIADYLKSQGIEYVYEKKMIVGGKPVKPDFYIPGKNAVIEYFGLMNDGGYRRRVEEKIKLYKDNNIYCIPIYQADLENLDYTIKARL